MSVPGSPGFPMRMHANSMYASGSGVAASGEYDDSYDETYDDDDDNDYDNDGEMRMGF